MGEGHGALCHCTGKTRDSKVMGMEKIGEEAVQPWQRQWWDGILRLFGCISYFASKDRVGTRVYFCRTTTTLKGPCAVIDKLQSEMRLRVGDDA